MSEYRPGEIVDITIKGARVHRTTAGPGFCVFEMDGGHIFIASDNVTVERVAPAEWPPRPGDVWRDRDGDVWFHLGRDGAELVCTRGSVYTQPDDVQREYGPLKLVHREDEQDRGAE